MNKISTRSPLAHLCLWLSPRDDFPNSYHEPSKRTAGALYCTVTPTHFTIPLRNTCLFSLTHMLGLITLLCQGRGSVVHNGLIFAVEDSRPKYCGCSMCVCVCSYVCAQKALSAEEPRFTYLTYIFIATGNT